jgi:perosamine synthetase|tara:strand:- start:2047 stop:2271 length:225 start_codon:yes stop_codon:yes gene_type:complete
MIKKLKSKIKQIYPVSFSIITKKEANNVSRVIRNGWISSDGPEIKKFEDNFSRFIGRKYSIAVSSGTAINEILK